MLAKPSFEEILAREYSGLSLKQKAAADYITANKLDVATRSLRTISASSGLAPATFSRLARALGFSEYEALREVLRNTVERQVATFSEKADKLQHDAENSDHPPFLYRQTNACIANISALNTAIDQTRLEDAVERLHKARNVILLGALGSTGIVEYLSYLANYFTTNWQCAGSMGASLGGTMAGLNGQDAMIIVTKPPFANRAIQAADMARAQGTYVIVITDTHTCPALPFANAGFIVPSDSPQFFSSYAATLALVETIIAMLVSRSGDSARQRIEQVENRNRRLEEIWDK